MMNWTHNFAFLLFGNVMCFYQHNIFSTSLSLSLSLNVDDKSSVYHQYDFRHIVWQQRANKEHFSIIFSATPTFVFLFIYFNNVEVSMVLEFAACFAQFHPENVQSFSLPYCIVNNKANIRNDTSVGFQCQTPLSFLIRLYKSNSPSACFPFVFDIFCYFNMIKLFW